MAFVHFHRYVYRYRAHPLPRRNPVAYIHPGTSPAVPPAFSPPILGKRNPWSAHYRPLEWWKYRVKRGARSIPSATAVPFTGTVLGQLIQQPTFLIDDLEHEPTFLADAGHNLEGL